MRELVLHQLYLGLDVSPVSAEDDLVAPAAEPGEPHLEGGRRASPRTPEVRTRSGPVLGTACRSAGRYMRPARRRTGRRRSRREEAGVAARRRTKPHVAVVLGDHSSPSAWISASGRPAGGCRGRGRRIVTAGGLGAALAGTSPATTAPARASSSCRPQPKWAAAGPVEGGVGGPAGEHGARLRRAGRRRCRGRRGRRWRSGPVGHGQAVALDMRDPDRNAHLAGQFGDGPGECGPVEPPALATIFTPRSWADRGLLRAAAGRWWRSRGQGPWPGCARG